MSAKKHYFLLKGSEVAIQIPSFFWLLTARSSSQEVCLHRKGRVTADG